MIDEGLAETIKSVAETAGTFGKGTILAVTLISFFGYNIVAQILGQVRSLSLITHFLMMSLIVPQNAIIFYSGLFEFVTFDIIPTDLVYDKLFDDSWVTEPFSEQAESIGYETRLIFSNLGSVTWMLVSLMVWHSILFILSRTADP